MNNWNEEKYKDTCLIKSIQITVITVLTFSISFVCLKNWYIWTFFLNLIIQWILFYVYVMKNFSIIEFIEKQIKKNK